MTLMINVMIKVYIQLRVFLIIHLNKFCYLLKRPLELHQRVTLSLQQIVNWVSPKLSKNFQIHLKLQLSVLNLSLHHKYKSHLVNNLMFYYPNRTLRDHNRV